MKLKTEEVTRPMQRVGVDVLGPWPMTASGNRFIIIYQDYFSKWVEIFAARQHTAYVVAEILVKEIISRYGIMERLHSDQGREFESQIYQEVCRMWDIKKTRTSPYTAWSNGQVERINATVKTMVKHYVDSAQNTWDRFLHYLRMAYNFTEHKSTKCTPFRLFFSRCSEPTVPLDLVYGTQKPEERLKCKQLYCLEQEVKSRKIFDIVRQNLEKSVSASQKYYNRKCVREHVYVPGELVLREYPPPCLILNWGQNMK
jgi:transposase InsO family protein